MNEPMTKADLLSLIQAGYARLDATLSQIADDRMSQTGVEEGWSIKDLLAHISWWQRRLIQLLQNAAQGEQAPSLLAAGEDWPTAIDRVNAEVHAANHDRPLSAIRAELEQSFQDTLATIGALSEQDLFDPQGFERIIGRPVADVIAANTYEHYQEHEDAIRAWLAAR